MLSPNIPPQMMFTNKNQHLSPEMSSIEYYLSKTKKEILLNYYEEVNFRRVLILFIGFIIEGFRYNILCRRKFPIFL